MSGTIPMVSDANNDCDIQVSARET